MLFLVFLVPSLLAGGRSEDRPQDPREFLEEADEDISQRRFDEAIPDLVEAVQADDEQFPAAEQRFEQIREARNAYNEAGQEVGARLRELISGDIPPDRVLEVAFQALALIDEMTDILPNPNPADRALISELQTRVLINIDRRRFQQLMDAALAEIEQGDYSRAVEIYVNGLGEYGFEPTTGEGEDEAQIEALLETDGIAIQILSFDPDEYELTGERFEAARETIRALTVGNDDAATAGEPADLASVAVPATAIASEIIAAFGDADLEAVQTLLADYLPLLEEIGSIYTAVLEASEIIAQQETINSERLSTDELYVYNWHIRFVHDIVFGRVAAADGTRREEGVLFAVRQFWNAAANEPVEAARSFGSVRYGQSLSELERFPWDELESPVDDAIVDGHVARAGEELKQVSFAYRTALAILELSRALELSLPADEDVPPATLAGPIVELLAEVDDEEFGRDLLATAVRVASAASIDDAVAIAADAFRTSLPLASSTSPGPLQAQRDAIRERLDSLDTLTAEWTALATSLEPLAISPGPIVSTTLTRHASYLAARMEQVRGYEIRVVRELTAIQVAEIQQQLAAARAALADAGDALGRTDPLSGAPRPLTSRARDRLEPFIGPADEPGSLAAITAAAIALEQRLSGEDAHVASDDRIRAFVAQLRALEAEATAPDTGLLAAVRETYERTLEQIAEAERLEAAASAGVEEILTLLDRADELNEAGNVLEGTRLIEQAERVLSGSPPDDVISRYSLSLANWYRPEVEERWDESREAISERLNDARRGIVVARVSELAAEAEPLIDPPPGEEARPGEAIVLLEEAEALWASVYPLIQNPEITPLLRRARLLESQQQQVLTEDTPGFARLSQILNTARTAFEDGDFQTAERALDFFLAEQPLNTEARLLETRIELATGQGSPDAIVRAFVTSALDETTTVPGGTGDGLAVEQAILSGNVSTEVFEGLLTLRSKLTAILQILREQGGASQENVNRIQSLLASINRILNPPPPPAPPNPRVVADQIIEEQLARGDWETLQTEQQTEVYEALVRARLLLPSYDRTNQLIALIQSYLPTVRLPSPAEQAILNTANRFIAQGDLNAALAELERYMAVAESDPMLIPAWRNLYNDLIRRLRGR